MLLNFLNEYLSIIIFLFVALTLSIGFIVLNYIFSPSKPDPEKLSAYECGFEPFEDARGRFDVRFYLVAILFIIFDLEVTFLFPWAITFGSLGILGFTSMMIFLAVLTIGVLLGFIIAFVQILSQKREIMYQRSKIKKLQC